MRRALALLCALALTLPLAACRREPWDAPAPTSDAPAESTPPAPEASGRAEAGSLSGLLAGLTAEDGGHVSGSSVPAEELISLLHEAVKNPVEHDSLTLNGSDTDVVWSVAFYPGRGEGPWFGDDGLYLFAGLEENVVEVFGGENLPDGTLYLKDEALYQCVRTGNDREGYINETWYERCRDWVDGYYDQRLEELRDAGYASWELTEFMGVLGTTKEDGRGAVAFRMQAAFRTDPPELAPHRIAGGAYVDSRLRVHGLDWQSVYLVTLNGEPVGVAFGDGILDFIEDHWGEAVDPEALREAVAAAARGG